VSYILGGFSEYRDEDAPVIYDVEEERMLLKKGTVNDRSIPAPANKFIEKLALF
jgi:hypothetical protein